MEFLLEAFVLVVVLTLGGLLFRYLGTNKKDRKEVMQMSKEEYKQYKIKQVPVIIKLVVSRKANE